MECDINSIVSCAKTTQEDNDKTENEGEQQYILEDIECKFVIPDLKIEDVEDPLTCDDVTTEPEEHSDIKLFATPSSSHHASSNNSGCESDDDNLTQDPVQRLVDGDSDDSDMSCVSEADSDVGTNSPTWTVSSKGMRHIEFIRESKLLVPIPGEGKPIDYFRLLMDDVFLENIARFTNDNALEILRNKIYLTPRSRITKWKDLTVPELLHFLGLLLHTGTIRLNHIQDYWKTDTLFTLPSSVFRSVMSRDRFLNILRCVYFHNPQHRENSSVEKVQYIVDNFNDMMQRVYYPDQELSIDEATALWRGHLHFRQCAYGKCHKYGVKIYTLTEHTGLILKFYVYTGSDTVVGGKGHREKIVLHLLKEFLDNGHSVYMGDSYNSFALASKLLEKNTYCTGTLSLDQKNVPLEVKSDILKKGETVARYGESVMIGKWRDKRVLSYISTQFENQMVNFHDKRKQMRKKPLPIIQYNCFDMGGADRADQLLSYYPCEKKTLRWYKKIFIHTLQMVMLNAFHLHNKYHCKMTLYDFRLSVIRALLPPLDRPVESPAQKRLRESAHKIRRSNERDQKKRLKRKNCRVCCRTKKNNKTSYYCETCPGKPGLCIGECFDQYHA